MHTNFFWRGNNYQFLHRLTVKSHLSVGHDVTVWLSGDVPRSSYWVSDLPVKIKDAAEVFEVTPFPQHARDVSSLWAYNLLHKRGGMYCGMDHVALKKFPDDPWILSSGNEGKWISNGIIKAPAKQDVFLDAIENFKKMTAARCLGAACNKRGLKITHKIEDFYPFPWYHTKELFKEKPLPDSYSLHLYMKMLEGLKLNEKNIREKHPNTMLERLVDRFAN